MKKYIILLLLVVYSMHTHAQITITANTSAPYVQYALNVDGVLWDGSNGTTNTTYPSPGNWTTNRTLTFADRDELQAHAEQFGISFETAKTICWQIRAKDANCRRLSCIGRWSSLTACTPFEAQIAGGLECEDCVELAVGDIRTENGVMLIDICEIDVITGECLNVVNTLTWTPDMTNYTYASPDGSIITNVVPDPANPGDFIVQQSANINNVNVEQTGNEVTITVDGQDPVCVQACCDAPPCLNVDLNAQGLATDDPVDISNTAIAYMNANGCGAGSTFFVREENCPRAALTTLTPGTTNILTRIVVANAPLSLTCPVELELIASNRGIIEDIINACLADFNIDATYAIDENATATSWKHNIYTPTSTGSINLIWSRDGIQRNQLFTPQCNTAIFEADANCNIIQTVFVPDEPDFVPHVFTSKCERDGSVIIELSGALDDVTIEPIETRTNADGSTSIIQCGVEVGSTSATLTCDEIRQQMAWTVAPDNVGGQNGNTYVMTMCGDYVTDIFVPNANTNTLDTLPDGVVVLYENGVEVSQAVINVPTGYAELTICNVDTVRVESSFSVGELSEVQYTNAADGNAPCSEAQINAALASAVTSGGVVVPCPGYILTYSFFGGKHVVTFGRTSGDPAPLPGFLTFIYKDQYGRLHNVTENTYCASAPSITLVDNLDNTGTIINELTGEELCVELCCDGTNGGVIDASTIAGFVNTEPEATNIILAHMLRFGYGSGTMYTFADGACNWVTRLPYGSLYAMQYRDASGGVVQSAGPSGQAVGTGDIDAFELDVEGLYVTLGFPASVEVVDDPGNSEWIVISTGNINPLSYFISVPGLLEFPPAQDCAQFEWVVDSDCNIIHTVPQVHNFYTVDSDQGRDSLYFIENGDTIRVVALNKNCCAPVNMETTTLSSGLVLAADATPAQVGAYVVEYFDDFPACDFNTKFFFDLPTGQDIYVSDCSGGALLINDAPAAAGAGNLNTLEYLGNLVLYENGVPVSVVPMQINDDPLTNCADIVLGDEVVSVQKCCPDLNGGAFSLYDLGVNELSTQQQIDSVISDHMIAGGYGVGTEYGFTEAVCALGSVSILHSSPSYDMQQSNDSIRYRFFDTNVDYNDLNISIAPSVPFNSFTSGADFLITIQATDITENQAYQIVFSGQKNGMSFEVGSWFSAELGSPHVAVMIEEPSIVDGCIPGSILRTNATAFYPANNPPVAIDNATAEITEIMGDGAVYVRDMPGSSFTFFNNNHEYTNTGIYDARTFYTSSAGDVYVDYQVSVNDGSVPGLAEPGKKFVIGERCEVIPIAAPLPCFLPCDYDPCGQTACQIDLNAEGMTDANIPQALQIIDDAIAANDCGRGSIFTFTTGQTSNSSVVPYGAGVTYTNINVTNLNSCPISITQGAGDFQEIKAAVESCMIGAGIEGTVTIHHIAEGFISIDIYNTDIVWFEVSGTDATGAAFVERSGDQGENHTWRINENCDLVKVETPPAVPINASSPHPCPEFYQHEVINICPGDSLLFPVTGLLGSYALRRPDGQPVSGAYMEANTEFCMFGTGYDDLDVNDDGVYYKIFENVIGVLPGYDFGLYTLEYIPNDGNGCPTLEARCPHIWEFYVMESSACRECDCEFSKNTTFFTTDGPIVDGFEVDTLYEITKIKTECCVVHTDTIKQWSNTFCAEGAVCEATTRNFYDTGSADCYTMFDTDFLQFNYEARLEGTSECNSENDSNNDRLTVTPSGSIVSSGGGVATLNYFEPDGTNWVLTVAAGATITHSIEGANVNNNGIDFLATPLSRSEVVDTTCTPVCFPPETAVFVSNLNTITSTFDLTMQMTSPSGIVGDGECFDIEIWNNNTVPPTDLTSLLPTPWHGVTGQALSTIDGFDSAIFPDGTEVIGHNATIQINKEPLAQIFGLVGNPGGVDLSTNITFNIVVGGTCDEVSMPMFANQSVENYQDDVCRVIHRQFENDNLLTNLNNSDTDPVLYFSEYAENPIWGGVGGISELSQGWVFNNPALCDGYINAQHGLAGPSLAGGDVFPATLRPDIILSKLIVSNEVRNFNLVYEQSSAGVGGINISAGDIAHNINRLDLYEGLEVTFTQDNLINCTERRAAYGIMSMCEGPTLEQVEFRNTATGDYVIYKIDAADGYNY